MQPEHHWSLSAIVERRGPDIQHETVFALTRRLPARHLQRPVDRWSGSRRCRGRVEQWMGRVLLGIDLGAAWCALRGTVAVFQCVANTRPTRRIDRGHEPIGTRRARAIGDALEDLDAAALDAADLAESRLRNYRSRARIPRGALTSRGLEQGAAGKRDDGSPLQKLAAANA